MPYNIMITNGSTFFNEVKAPRSIETDEMLPRKRWSDYDTIFDFNNNTNYYNNIFGSVDNLKNDDPSPNGTFNSTALFEIDSIKSKSGLKQNFDFDPQDHTKSRSNKVIYKRRNAVSEEPRRRKAKLFRTLKSMKLRKEASTWHAASATAARPWEYCECCTKSLKPATASGLCDSLQLVASCRNCRAFDPRPSLVPHRAGRNGQTQPW